MRKALLLLFAVIAVSVSMPCTHNLLFAEEVSQAETWTRAIKEIRRRIQENDRAVALYDARVTGKSREREEARAQNHDATALDSEIDRLQQERTIRINASKHWKDELLRVSE